MDLRKRTGINAQLLQSPMISSHKWDANEMLKAGLLADFLSRQLSVDCLGVIDNVPS
jgi:hypothetical protein